MSEADHKRPRRRAAGWLLAGILLLAAGCGWAGTRVARRLSVGASRGVALYLGLCCCGGALYLWNGEHASISSGLGLRFPGGRHLSTLAI